MSFITCAFVVLCIIKFYALLRPTAIFRIDIRAKRMPPSLIVRFAGQSVLFQPPGKPCPGNRGTLLYMSPTAL